MNSNWSSNLVIYKRLPEYIVDLLIYNLLPCHLFYSFPTNSLQVAPDIHSRFQDAYCHIHSYTTQLFHHIYAVHNWSCVHHKSIKEQTYVFFKPFSLLVWKCGIFRSRSLIWTNTSTSVILVHSALASINDADCSMSLSRLYRHR